MEEKAKSKVLIYIIVVLVAIIVLLSIGGIYLYKELSKQENNNQLQSELNQEEKQVDKEIQIINDKEAKQNILVNGKVVEVKATIIDIAKEKVVAEPEDIERYKVNTKIEIDGKEVEKIEQMVTVKEDIKISNAFANVTTIKGEENKDYIVVQTLFYDKLPGNVDYIFNEEGIKITQFEYSWFDRLKIREEEYQDFIQIKDNCIIEFRRKYDDDYKLEKWQVTIRDNKLIYKLLDKYKENEIESTKEW